MPDEKQPSASPPAPQFTTRRRSERLFLTIPIRVSGTNPKGRDFSEDCVSVDVSRNGARIRLNNALVADDVISIKNLKNNQETVFRVVGRVGQPHPDLPYADWGVEVVDPNIVIWGVELKENPAEDIATSALLQCSVCLVVSSFLLTHKDVGAAAASAFLRRDCPRCGRETLWSYVTSDRRSPSTEAPKPVVNEEAERRERERRMDKRLAVQFPIRIRTAEGTVEVTKTVNLSASGARFLSAHVYPTGGMVFVAAPYREGEDAIEMRATIEHIEAPDSEKGNRLVGIKA
ncbi:MAG: PilZ domain-containing protein, partial [Candidatus Acidiferrales bacterium]